MNFVAGQKIKPAAKAIAAGILDQSWFRQIIMAE